MSATKGSYATIASSLDMSVQDKTYELTNVVCSSMEGSLRILFSLNHNLDTTTSTPEQKIDIFELPGFAKLHMDVTGFPGKARRELRWMWKSEDQVFPKQRAYFTYFKKDKLYELCYSWNAENGRLDTYLQGYRVATTHHTWSKKIIIEKLLLHKGPYTIENISYSSSSEASKKSGHTFSQDVLNPPSEIGQNHQGQTYEERDVATPLYVNPLASAADLKGWVQEGAGELIFNDGWMEIISPAKHPKTMSGHITYWCPVELPENYSIEWEFKLINKKGLAILFIDAKGLKGEDIFDPSLSRRDGSFPQYWKGDFRSYHFSYFDEDNWVRVNKNPHKTLLTQGYREKYLVQQAYQMKVIKKGTAITLLIDGKICFQVEDSLNEFGAHWSGGKVGFRQMMPSHIAYRNLKISTPVK
jgi:hypothetical protein